VSATAVEQRVKVGAALLNEKKPGWEQKIDRSALAMWHPYRCILGQLYGFYHEGTAQLGLSRDRSAAHGFICLPQGECQCDELAEVWRTLLARRGAP
jgi:hypothetical protein